MSDQRLSYVPRDGPVGPDQQRGFRERLGTLPPASLAALSGVVALLIVLILLSVTGTISWARGPWASAQSPDTTATTDAVLYTQARQQYSKVVDQLVGCNTPGCMPTFLKAIQGIQFPSWMATDVREIVSASGALQVAAFGNAFCGPVVAPNPATSNCVNFTLDQATSRWAGAAAAIRFDLELPQTGKYP